MGVSLHPETPAGILSNLIVSDIAPIRAKASKDTVQHIEGMEQIEVSRITNRKDADKILEGYETVVQFTNTFLTCQNDRFVSGSKRPCIPAH